MGSGEFFQVVLPDGSRLAHAISAGSKHPLSFGRDVAAQLAGVPARADWKACQVSYGSCLAQCPLCLWRSAYTACYSHP